MRSRSSMCIINNLVYFIYGLTLPYIRVICILCNNVNIACGQKTVSLAKHIETFTGKTMTYLLHL